MKKLQLEKEYLDTLFDIDWNRKLISLKKDEKGNEVTFLNTQQLYNWSMQMAASLEGITHDEPFEGCGFLGLQPVIKIINDYHIILPSVDKFTIYGYIITDKPGNLIFSNEGLKAEITMIRYSRPYANLFISYSSKDKDFARQLNEPLSKIAETFFDETDIHPGDSVIGRIEQGLLNADNLILVVSQNSIDSNWVGKEWKAMMHLKKKILPIILDDVEVPPLLKDISHIKYKGDMVELIQKLSTSL